MWRGYREPRDDIHTIVLNVDIDVAAKDGPSPLDRLRPPAGPERRVSGLGRQPRGLHRGRGGADRQ